VVDQNEMDDIFEEQEDNEDNDLNNGSGNNDEQNEYRAKVLSSKQRIKEIEKIRLN